MRERREFDDPLLYGEKTQTGGRGRKRTFYTLQLPHGKKKEGGRCSLIGEVQKGKGELEGSKTSLPKST